MKKKNAKYYDVNELLKKNKKELNTIPKEDIITLTEAEAQDSEWLEIQSTLDKYRFKAE